MLESLPEASQVLTGPKTRQKGTDGFAACCLAAAQQAEQQERGAGTEKRSRRGSRMGRSKMGEQEHVEETLWWRA